MAANTPFDLFKTIVMKCPDKIKFNVNAIPDSFWRAVNTFGLLPNFSDIPPLVSCETLPEFADAENIVRFIYAAVTTPNPADILDNYKRLSYIRDKALAKLNYPNAAEDIANNPVLDVGIYLLDDKIDQLPPTNNLLDALVKIRDLLPKELSDAYAEYVLYVTGFVKKEIGKRARREQERSRTGAVSPEFAVFEPLIEQAVEYCRSVVKPRPNPGMPGSVLEFPSVSPYKVWTSLSSKLALAGIKSVDVSTIDVHLIDCSAIYDKAYNEATSPRYIPPVRQLIMYNKVATLLADALYSLIASRSTVTPPSTKIEAEEKRYEELSKKEEKKLEAVEELLNELYSATVGKHTTLGIPSSQIPDFLAAYLSLLEQAGLSPKDYQTLEEMFTVFMELLNEANLSPSQYKKILEKVVVLPPAIQRRAAISILQVLNDYAAGKISATEATDAILSILGKFVPQPQPPPAVPQPQQPPPRPSPPPAIPQPQPPPAVPQPQQPPPRPQWLNQLLQYRDYIITESKQQFIRYFTKYDVKRSLVFAYDNALIVIPDPDFSRTDKMAVFYSPQHTKLFVEDAKSWGGRYRGYGSFSPTYYGPIIGAEVNLGRVDDEQSIEFIFRIPVVKVERYAYSQVQYLLSLKGLNLCIIYINNGSLYGVIENCTITEKPGSILRMTPHGFETYMSRV